MDDVLHSLQQNNMFDKFKIQLQNDFNLAGLEEYAPIITTNNLNDIVDAVLNSILNIEKFEPTAISNLLYRIDVSEHKIQQEVAKIQSLNFNVIITELIIKRTIQKIILKQHYS